MNLWQNYFGPSTIAETLSILKTAPRPLAVVAGGTDLLIDLKQGRHEPVQSLVDISETKELTQLEIRGDRLFIGAAVTINRLAADPLAATHASALQDACNLVAGPQVRNVATLGGNVAHALPAADGTISLLCLAATAEIAGFDGLREVPISVIFRGPGVSSLKPGEEILTGFNVPLSRAGEASAFQRIMRPQGVALPILNCANWLSRDGRLVRDLRISIGPGGAVPFRAVESETILRGKLFDEALLEKTIESVLGEAKYRTSARRASREYRRHLTRELLRDTFQAAWQRAMAQGGSHD